MYMFIRSFEELTAVTVQILVFWFIRPCRLVGSYQGFGDTSAFIFSAYVTHHPQDVGSMSARR